MKFYCESMAVVATGSIGIDILPRFLMLSRRCFATKIQLYLTKSAEKLSSSFALGNYCGSAPYLDTNREASMEVSDQVASYNLTVVLPATAHFISSLACGICYSTSLAIVMESKCPIIIFPSMNAQMWHAPSTQQNITTLRKWGYTVVEPDRGIEVATLKTEIGAMPPMDRIFLELARALKVTQLPTII